MKNILELFDIKEESKVPKYKQIVDSILRAIDSAKLKLNDKLPSVNDLLIEFDVSRDTVVRAYDQLKQRKVIESVPGKGYYVKVENLSLKAKVFLIFNKLSAHKKLIYDAFAKTLGDDGTIDFFIYENNYRHFKDLILAGKKRDYSHFVTICHFEEGGDDLLSFLQAEIPLEKLIVLDKKVDGLGTKVASIYQDFENDIYNALMKLNTQLRKYSKINLLSRDATYHPKEINKGFIKFCGQQDYDFEVIADLAGTELKSGSVYICLMEDDLVNLLKKLNQTEFQLGEDIGIISYNETPIKEVLRDGITVISTDFENLGKTAAEMVLNNNVAQVENPFYVIHRNSL